MTMIGTVSLGARGPQANVFPSATLLGPPSIDHPVRVPNASFRNIGVFVQDEWDVSSAMRLTGGLRVDGYRVVTEPTPGYSVQSLVIGAVPAIDPSSLPSVGRERLSRTALTGEAGVVIWPARSLSPFAHYVRSYRHPNLEELLFSGPATAGNIVPNLKVEPETGHNIDVGVKVRTGALGWVAVVLQQHVRRLHLDRGRRAVADGIASRRPSTSRGCASRVSRRRQTCRSGWRASSGRHPERSRGIAARFCRDRARSSSSPDEPQDNITPWKVTAGIRVSDRRASWWAGYDVRMETDVTRVSPLLSESPFLIAQDLLCPRAASLSIAWPPAMTGAKADSVSASRSRPTT